MQSSEAVTSEGAINAGEPRSSKMFSVKSEPTGNYLSLVQSKSQKVIWSFDDEEPTVYLADVLPAPKSLFEKFEQIARAGEKHPKSLIELNLFIQAKIGKKATESPKIVCENSPEIQSYKGPVISFDRLGECCRIMSICDDRLSDDFNIVLQVMVGEQWVNVALYEYRHGSGYKYSFHSKYFRRPFQMDLPGSVVREMASEDLHRNWITYCREFIQLLHKPA